ncbi:MAG: hypothetical protein HOC23_12485 [Halieaceae bacterium]|jgi:hypothetical protein|nr:hypothetical protein [Halieaceae bacterium]
MLSSRDVSDQLALIICSYRPDFERCARLCASMDAFVGPEAIQFVVVPDRDRQIFAPLESGNRTIVSVQDVLPARFVHLPLLKKWWLDNALWPTRGWMMQQVTKLCADAVTDCENILFVDSDIEFIRKLQPSRFVRENALRLHRKPMEKNDGIHLRWHHGAADLLGLAPRYFGSDYIGPLATWRRSNLIQLKRHIEKQQQRPWHEAVGRRVTVSEYTLYGVFVEHVLGVEASGHFQDSTDLCHCLWSEDGTEKFLTEFDYKDSNFPQAVLLQSNMGLDQRDVSLLMDRVRQNLQPSTPGGWGHL